MMLIELLLSLILFTLLLIHCFPVNLINYQKNQLQLRENEISSAIHYARNKALSSQQVLALTPLPDSQNWSEGMILFIDNETHQYTKDDEIIYQWTWKNNDIHISWQGFLSNNYLLFAKDLKRAASSGNFKLSNEKGDTLKLVVNRMGHISK